MPSTLVTGANSFVAAHIINALIAAGHKVTGTVRRESAKQDVFAARPEWEGKLDVVIIGDYSKDESWTELLKSGNFDHVRVALRRPPG